MKFLWIVLATIAALSFSACSSKEVYEPRYVQDDWAYTGKSDVLIQNVASEAALVQDRKVLAKGRVFDVRIKEEYKLLGYSDGWILSASSDGNVTLEYATDKTMVEKFDLKRTVAAAAIKNDLLAVLFANNEMALYSIADKKLLFKEQGEPPIVVNAKITKPFIKDDLVVFSTLDGKIVIVNAKEKKRLRTSIVSTQEHFNNIIYFALLENKIIAATGNKILSLAQKEIRNAHDIRDVLVDGKNIYLATKQGEIISLTSDLQQNAKLKFPFAHFLGMIAYKENLYLLEKEGYLLEITKDLSHYNVYEVDIDDGYLYIDDKIFFVDDVYISVQ